MSTIHGLLPLVILLPLGGAAVLALAGARLPARAVAAIGCGTVGVAAVLTAAVAVAFAGVRAEAAFVARPLAHWIAVPGLAVEFGLHLDALSLLMTAVVTGVGFLIHLYAVGYMAGDDGFARFFAYLNLFVAAMLVLVLADNLVFLLLGWEGVGLCSYLLIGFWYRDPANGAAARKAFVVTRVGDTALLVAMFVIFERLGTLHIAGVLAAAPAAAAAGALPVALVAALLLGGAVGKSAQLPLQTWLPDAMAGPTPVSALIHAATMVTAGVYLIARHHALFLLAPAVLGAVAAVGALTLLVAGLAALAQTDLKRVLAYSTISQIGYMFLALGAGAWTAAMFHFFTHALFKALLFLAAGAVIHALHGEQDMARMGGLRTRLPLVFWTFAAGAASLAAVPLVSAGFYSKDAILLHAGAGPLGGPWLLAAGLAGAGITALYTGRMVGLTFLGTPRAKAVHGPGWCMAAPLVVLAVLSTVAGFLETPHNLGGIAGFSGFLSGALPAPAAAAPAVGEGPLQLAAGALALGGLAAGLHLWRPGRAAAPGGAAALRDLWRGGGGFDWAYDRLLVRPFTALAGINRRDVVDRAYDGLAAACLALHAHLSSTQDGGLRRYAMGVAVGAIVLLLTAAYL